MANPRRRCGDDEFALVSEEQGTTEHTEEQGTTEHAEEQGTTEYTEHTEA